ncbi:hypothetical protein G6F65_022299 [Rhizopus arrhizus]|nr:hypothetical protein G6F65_022299 [Rhizopus arrhizus]
MNPDLYRGRWRLRRSYVCRLRAILGWGLAPNQTSRLLTTGCMPSEPAPTPLEEQKANAPQSRTSDHLERTFPPPDHPLQSSARPERQKGLDHSAPPSHDRLIQSA